MYSEMRFGLWMYLNICTCRKYMWTVIFSKPSKLFVLFSSTNVSSWHCAVCRRARGKPFFRMANVDCSHEKKSSPALARRLSFASRSSKHSRWSQWTHHMICNQASIIRSCRSCCIIACRCRAVTCTFVTLRVVSLLTCPPVVITEADNANPF